MSIIRKKKIIYSVFIIAIAVILPNHLFAQDEKGNSMVMGLVNKQNVNTILEEERLTYRAFPLKEMRIDFTVLRLLFTPDGRSLVTTDENGGIRLWDIADGFSLRSVLAGDTKGIFSLAISGDGRYLASGGRDQVIKIWSVAKAKLVKTINDYNGAITDLAFSPDGSILGSANLGDLIEFWEVKRAKFYHVKTLDNTGASLYTIAFHPSSKYLASGDRKMQIILWPLGIKGKEKVIMGHTQIVLDVAFSHKGDMLASGGADNTVYLWDISLDKDRLNVSKEPFFYHVHRGWVTKVDFSPHDDFLITSSQDGCIRIWDFSKKKLVKVIPVIENEPIFDFTLSPDEKYLAVAVRGGKIFVYAWPDLIAGKKKDIKNTSVRPKDARSTASVSEGATYHPRLTGEDE